ncbi:MAG: glycogen debranching enzyme N-terminal domain-containing protein [Desulfobacteraceae bacterium]|nr:glycogen debranching enzyme N-terminal domain-containing protein [Desulfobacteraceae bacterium]
MNISDQISQVPAPGRHLLHFRGDTLSFELTAPADAAGSAWVRTNIGHADLARRQIIHAVTRDLPPLARDWFDIPLQPVSPGRFRVTLPLCEVGHFQAKCFFLDTGASEPVWPAGDNTVVNVAPAESCAANIVYNAFVRQFGPNQSGRFQPDAARRKCIAALDRDRYTVIPPSGTFRDLIRELDFIVGELGCRILQLLPIHPTPTTYARMGRFGSPYAALSFTEVDPALAQFDPKATPLEQFIELVDAVHERNARLYLDVAINHTGWAASLHETHPEWLARDPEGRIEVPGAWGVRWEDLTRLDFSHKDLWRYMAEVFLRWCRRGVDGFRCDAGYMIPVEAWRYIVASVRSQFPDTVFLLEGLGGKMSVTCKILSRANFDAAYSELFQNYNRGQIEYYLPEPLEISRSDGLMVHFAETHDNNRLAARSPAYARMRTALCALLADHGAFGFANGVEWYATEKIIVHEAPSLNWGAEPNQVAWIRRLSDLLKTHPAFHAEVELKMMQQGEGEFIVMRRRHRPSGRSLLVAANLDDRQPVTAGWNPRQVEIAAEAWVDLLTGQRVVPREAGTRRLLPLAPGQVMCLSPEPSDLALLEGAADPLRLPARIAHQCLRAKALEVCQILSQTADLGGFDPDAGAARLAADPAAFCREAGPDNAPPRITRWQWPTDCRRTVMLPPGHLLLVIAPLPFHARIIQEGRTLAAEKSLARQDGTHFALFTPLPTPRRHQRQKLKLTVFSPGRSTHAQGPLLQLAAARDAAAMRVFSHTEIRRRKPLFLAANGRGAMTHLPVMWGRLESRYDAILAANLDPEVPEDRRVLFTRCRGWLVYQGYSQALSFDCLHQFRLDAPSRGTWHFHVPTGQGQHVFLALTLTMAPLQNRVQLRFQRLPAEGRASRLDDRRPVELILRPDVEDRSFHDTTKAYTGPEKTFAAAVQPAADGFHFAPAGDHGLTVRLPGGRFTAAPEWTYMVHRPLEATRGLDPDSDLFSPGYFSCLLAGGDQVEMTAVARRASDPAAQTTVLPPPKELPLRWPLAEALAGALDQYVVKRGALRSVIAGYPWFLDWGRDALIVVRGLITAGKTAAAAAVLQQFGQFTENGTLPNMIHGKNAGNRDTSDAPLWFVVACGDLIRRQRSRRFLESDCGGRRLGEVLLDLGAALMAGTPNGVRMDPASGLLYSPGHFTWMDTNFPAGTLRAGYPVEIQALWFAALSVLKRIDPQESGGPWQKTAARVRRGLQQHFWQEQAGYLADCLHATPDTPPQRAEIDDALRPNQLFALTLGALSAPEACRRVLTACETLLVPGAIRSLADQPVSRPHPILHQDQLLNDPHNPYQGRYLGDEDTRRKPAYHNGTAWTWVFPSFCEAWALTYGKAGHATALAWLASGTRLLNRGCCLQMPEIVDGDAPHQQRGCDAQAWGVSELLRVWLKLQS